MDVNALEPLVDRALRDQFPDAAVSQVIVEPDIDSDGARILRITVVLEDINLLLGKESLVSFVRHLRGRLAEADRDEFPLLSFVYSDSLKIRADPLP